MAQMISGTMLRFALHILQQNGGARPDATFNSLNQMLRPPAYEHEVRVPIMRASAEDNFIGPSREATDWLRRERQKGTIGPWDATLCNDAMMPRWKLEDLLPLTQSIEMTDHVVVNEYYVIVSFLMEEDAMLFRLKW